MFVQRFALRRPGVRTVFHWQDTEDSAAAAGRRLGWFTLAAGLAGLAIIGLFIATPTLNLDDLGYVTQWPVTFTHPQFWSVLSTVFLNADLGVTEMRTYGLSRALHILTIAVFGKAPVGAYLTIAVLHLGSSFLIFALLREITGDRIIGVFAAVVWAASPAVLPFFKSEHHFLYSIAAFYPLLAWVVLSAKDGQGFPQHWGRNVAGVALLTAACLMGESAIIAVGTGVLATAWARRNPRLIAQGLAAAVLLALYVLHEKFFHQRPRARSAFRSPRSIRLFCRPPWRRCWRTERPFSATAITPPNSPVASAASTPSKAWRPA